MPSPFTTDFQLLPSEAVEKWHSQDDVDDPPFKRPLRAMMAHHAAVDRAAELVVEIKSAETKASFYGKALWVSVLCFFVGISVAIFYLYAAVVSIVCVIAGSFFYRRMVLAQASLRGLVAEEDRVKNEIEAQYAMAQNLVMEADRKIVDLGPPPDEAPDAPVEQK